MALTFIASVIGTNNSSGSTLDCSSTLNVAAGDILVCITRWEDNAAYTATVAEDDGSTNAFTMCDSVTYSTQIQTCMGYVLNADASATATFRFTISPNPVSYREIVVMQFRPSEGMVGELGDKNNGGNGSSTAPLSANATTAGDDIVGVGTVSCYAGRTITDHQIADAAADGVVTGAGGDASAYWYKIFTSTQTDVHAQATLNSATGWACDLLLIKTKSNAPLFGTEADVLFAFESGSNNDVVTAANVAAGALPNPPPGTLITIPTSLTYTLIRTDAQMDLGGAVVVDSTSYTDSGSTRGIRRDLSQATENIQLTLPVYKDKVSVGFRFKTDLPITGYTSHTALKIEGDGSEYVVFACNPNNVSNIPVALETISGDTTGLTISTNTEYWVSMLYDKTAAEGKLALYTAGLVQIGSTITASLIENPPQVQYINIGGTDHEEYPSAFTYFDNVMIDWTNAAFPLLPAVSARYVPAIYFAQQMRT